MNSCLVIPLAVNQKVPKIYVACAAAAEKGITHGVWVNATQKFKDITATIESMLTKSPANGKTFLIRDYQGFGSFEIGKQENIEHDIHLKALLISKYGELAPQVFAYCNKDLDDTILALTHHYIGAYQSERDFAMRLFNQSYLKSPDNEIEPYVNYNQFRKDIFERDYFSIKVENKTHVFVRH